MEPDGSMDYLLIPIGIGFYVCFLLNEVFIPWASERGFSGYKKLDRSCYLEWNARWTSTIHALVVCGCSSWCLLFHEEIWKNKLFNTDRLSQLTLSFTCGYMIYDLLSMIWYTKGLPLLTYLAHHLVVIAGSVMILVYNLGAFFAHVKILTELSTPLLNLRWFIRQVGYPVKHPLFAATTLLMAACFISVRIISAPPFWILIHRSMNEVLLQDANSRLESYRIPVYIFGISLDILNLFWSVHIGLRCRSSIRDLLEHYQLSKSTRRKQLNDPEEEVDLPAF